MINIIRFALLFFLQVLIFKRMSLGWMSFGYVNIMVYPLFIMLLPLRMSRPAVLLTAFALGLLVDMFYDSPGVHASATVFMAFLRPGILTWLEPREGYNVNYSPTMERLGSLRFFQYAGLMLAGHLLCYFMVETFAFAYIVDILLKTLFTFVISMAFIAMLMFALNPKD